MCVLGHLKSAALFRRNRATWHRACPGTGKDLMPRSQPHRNRLLAAISQKSRKHLLSTSSEVLLDSKTVLHESQARPSHAFISDLRSRVRSCSHHGRTCRGNWRCRSRGLYWRLAPYRSGRCTYALPDAACGGGNARSVQPSTESLSAGRRRPSPDPGVCASADAWSEPGGRMPPSTRRVAATHALAFDSAGSHKVFHHRHSAGGVERESRHQACHHRSGSGEAAAGQAH